MTGKPNALLIYGVLLFVLAAFTVSQALKLSELDDAFESVPKVSNLDGVIEQQAALRTELEVLEAKDFITATQYQSDRLELNQQIDSLGHSLTSPDVQILHEELNSLALEVDVVKQDLMQLQKAAATAPAPTASPAQTKSRQTAPQAITPPFTVIGLEWRGGESFLAVSPTHAPRLADVSLLRAGDSLDGWRLFAIEPGQARFALPNGRRHVLNIR
jgi:hypothetical protein